MLVDTEFTPRQISSLQPKETKSLINHDCEFQASLAKAEKKIKRKKTEITILNRIIQGQKQQIQELQRVNETLRSEIQEQRQQLASIKTQKSQLGFFSAKKRKVKKQKQKRQQNKQSTPEKNNLQSSSSLSLKTFKLCSSTKFNKLSQITDKTTKNVAGVEVFKKEKMMNMGEMFMNRKISSENDSEREMLHKTWKIQPFNRLKTPHIQPLERFEKNKSPDPCISAKMAIEELLKQNYDLKKIKF